MKPTSICVKKMFLIFLKYFEIVLNAIFLKLSIKHLTANLVLKKPKDPIRALIDQLKEIEQSENK